MHIYVPNTVRDEAEEIKIFIPYVKVQPATLISLIGYIYTPVKTSGKFGYFNYFKKRWKEGETFINVEQDIVVYPGALKALWDCPSPWCVYDFHLPNHWGRNLENEKIGIPIGCVKISAEVISKTKNHWETEPVEPVMCEQHLTKIINKGLQVHQHFPSVVNANPALLGMN